VCVCVCVCVCVVYMFYSISSPHLIVFGDGRVCGTRELIMFQVDPMRFRDGAWASLGVFHKVVFNYLWNLHICNH